MPHVPITYFRPGERNIVELGADAGDGYIESVVVYRSICVKFNVQSAIVEIFTVRVYVRQASADGLFRAIQRAIDCKRIQTCRAVRRFDRKGGNQEM